MCHVPLADLTCDREMRRRGRSGRTDAVADRRRRASQYTVDVALSDRLAAVGFDPAALRAASWRCALASPADAVEARSEARLLDLSRAVEASQCLRTELHSQAGNRDDSGRRRMHGNANWRRMRDDRHGAELDLADDDQRNAGRLCAPERFTHLRRAAGTKSILGVEPERSAHPAIGASRGRPAVRAPRRSCGTA